MITLETLAIINNDSESGVVEDSRPETAKLPPFGTVKSEQIESEAHVPGQIEVNLSGPSIRNALLINNRKPIQTNNNNTKFVKTEATEQKKIYAKCLKLVRFLGFPLGMRISYDWIPQRYFLFHLMCFFHCLTTFSVLYTVYVYYINGSYMRILEPLAVAGLVASCGLKLYGFLWHGKKIFSLFFSIRKYFRPNVFGRQAEIIKSSLQETWAFLCIFVCVCVICVTIYVWTPIIVYMTRNEVIPLVSLEIIFCDQTQKSGFLVTTIIHLIIGSYSAVITATYGTAMIFCFCNYILLSNLIAEDFKELGEMWNGINNISVAYKRAFLRNICKKRQDMNKYAF